MFHVLGQEEVAPKEMLEGLVECWSSWDGIVHTVTGFTGHVNVYIKMCGLKTLLHLAQSCLVAQLMEAPEKCFRVVGLVHIFSNIHAFPHGLLHQVCLAGETLSTFPDTVTQQWPAKLVGRVQEFYGQIKVVTEEHISQNQATKIGQQNSKDDKGNGPKIIVHFPNGTKLAIKAHFVESSGLLTNLHSRDGKIIRWHTNDHVETFRKTKEFFDGYEAAPMPAIALPLHSSDMAVLVGSEFAQLTGSLEPPRLFLLAHFATFLQLEKFLDLCVLVKGTAAETRALFNN